MLFALRTAFQVQVCVGSVNWLIDVHFIVVLAGEDGAATNIAVDGCFAFLKLQEVLLSYRLPSGGWVRRAIQNYNLLSPVFAHCSETPETLQQPTSSFMQPAKQLSSVTE